MSQRTGTRAGPRPQYLRKGTTAGHSTYRRSGLGGGSKSSSGEERTKGIRPHWRVDWAHLPEQEFRPGSGIILFEPGMVLVATGRSCSARMTSWNGFLHPPKGPSRCMHYRIRRIHNTLPGNIPDPSYRKAPCAQESLLFCLHFPIQFLYGNNSSPIIS